MDYGSDNPIKKDTFEGMEVSSKLNVLFDMVHSINSRAPLCRREIDAHCVAQVKSCKTKFDKIDGRQKLVLVVNTTASLVGGFIGGWSAVWISFKFSIFGG